MFDVPVWFIERRHKANRIELCNVFNYRIGEFNSEIVEWFAEKYLKTGDVVWEPFAGHFGPNKTIDICKRHEVELIATDIAPCDDRVCKRNATQWFPDCKLNGAIFHPPYFGSAQMSNEYGEISLLDEDKYFADLRKISETIDCGLTAGGFVCVVGRTIVKEKKKFPLEWMFTKLFLDCGLKVRDFCNAIPDWAIILEKENG